MGRRGRPFVEDRRDKKYMIRINDVEEEMLNYICKTTGMGRADVFRTALERMHDNEKSNEDYPLSPLLDRKKHGSKR